MAMVTGNASEVQPAGGSAEPSAPNAPKGGVDPRWWVAALVVAAAVAMFWPKGDGSKSAPGGFAVDGMGLPAKLADRMAPVTLVHFWSTWCPPCIDEIPTLQKLQRDLADRHDFKVILIAVADDPTKVRKFLGDAPADSLLFDPDWDVAHRYGSTQLPETYLIAEGRVVEKFVGATNWNDPAVRKKIEDRL